jgi:pyruvate formate lyase activating enzyme
VLALTGFALVQGLTRRPEEVKKTLQNLSSFPLELSVVKSHGLSLHPALFWEAIDGGRDVRCNLCPMACRIVPGSRGACRVRYNLDGRLVSLVYGRPLALSCDPVEKKPLFHVLTGSSTFSIATAGCNLGCLFCQNWSISQAFPEEADFYVLYRGKFVHRHRFLARAAPGAAFEAVLPARIAEAAVNQGCKSVAFTYTEPSVFYEYMLDTAVRAREKGLRTLWITCGYILPKPLRRLCPHLDAANVDLKGMSEDFYRTYCRARLAPVLTTLRVLREEGVWIEVTNLVIPKANDSDAMLRDLSRWVLRELGPDTPVHFSRFHPDYKLNDRSPTPIATLLRAREIAKEEGLRYVYVGNARVPDGGTTFCPGCGIRLVERRGYEIVSFRLRHGACPECGTVIPGIWK